MFTGIIENLGKIEKKTYTKGLLQLTISVDDLSEQPEIGESIAVNGICLTLTKIEGNRLTFDVMQETIEKTNLEDLKIKDLVNLERALRANARISGHFVSGHIDGVGIIRRKEIRNGSYVFYIAVNKELIPYIISKGSVA
ncbi:MAG: riboflavin synthase, partial [Candidatus Omnitrophica bacterium]|nr:riboflavin synthase [Candidatus Omnitrophota bacterium]